MVGTSAISGTSILTGFDYVWGRFTAPPGRPAARPLRAATFLTGKGAAMSTQAELDAIQTEVGAWLDANWRPERPKQEWLAMVVDAGYAVPTWSRQWYGRELDSDAATLIAAEFRKRNAPGARQDVHNLWANTALAYGTESL